MISVNIIMLLPFIEQLLRASHEWAHVIFARSTEAATVDHSFSSHDSSRLVE